jgi:hypothetical protein
LNKSTNKSLDFTHDLAFSVNDSTELVKV